MGETRQAFHTGIFLQICPRAGCHHQDRQPIWCPHSCLWKFCYWALPLPLGSSTNALGTRLFLAASLKLAATFGFVNSYFFKGSSSCWVAALFVPCWTSHELGLLVVPRTSFESPPIGSQLCGRRTWPFLVFSFSEENCSLPICERLTLLFCLLQPSSMRRSIYT